MLLFFGYSRYIDKNLNIEYVSIFEDVGVSVGRLGRAAGLT